MTSFQRDPYPWLHLAGLATVPFWLDVCLVGLAVGDPTVPPWLELGMLGALGGLPVLWMQWQRPFYIFSLLAIAIRPDTLDENRRSFLTLQRSWPNRLFSLAGAVILLGALIFLYQLAPIAAEVSPLTGKSRAVGWLVCLISFLLANLFVQVPASVLQVLATPASTIQTMQPYAVDSVLKDFTVVGLRVSRILPELADASSAVTSSVLQPVTTQAGTPELEEAIEPAETSAFAEPVDHPQDEEKETGPDTAEQTDQLHPASGEAGQPGDAITDAGIFASAADADAAFLHAGSQQVIPSDELLNTSDDMSEDTTSAIGEVSEDSEKNMEILPAMTPSEVEVAAEVEVIEGSDATSDSEKPSVDYSTLYKG